MRCGVPTEVQRAMIDRTALPDPVRPVCLARRLGGAGRHRGGFGVDYQIRLLRGEAKASFLMDHGRVGPPSLLGGSPGAVNEIAVGQGGVVSSPPHLSKGEGYVLAPEDWIAVKTPGGGGYGPAAERDPAMVERDVARGYYTDAEVLRLFTRAIAAE